MKLENMKNYFLEYVKINLSNGTYLCYKSHLDFTIKYFNERYILDSNEINFNVLSNFIEYQKIRGVKNSTINKRLKPLKLMYRFNNILDNEIFLQKKLKEDKKTFPILSKCEMQKLNIYLSSNKLSFKNQLLIKLLIDTGVRLNEILNIKVKNINFDNFTIYLDVTKTKKSRYVYFTNDTLKLLIKYIKKSNLTKNDKLFDLTSSGVLSLFYRIKNTLNFKEFHPHMLRHGLATNLNKKGMSVFEIQQIMGHENVATTNRYIHLDQDDICHKYLQLMN
ncbi:phage integrase family protein [Staphylococcus sp. CAG:324]|nr:phage integrase family protein [Staphylococcus sp. CAG:324]